MTTDITSTTTTLRERGAAGMRVPPVCDESSGRTSPSPSPLPERGKPEPPERSQAQRMSALEVANDIRSHRAGLKREIKARRVSPTVALTDPKCATMLVLDLLLAAPKVGRVKAYRVLDEAAISRSKTIGGMSDRQLGELSRYFRGLPIQRARIRSGASIPRAKRTLIRERPDRGTAGLLDDIRGVRA